jgi:hypothetical protein
MVEEVWRNLGTMKKNGEEGVGEFKSVKSEIEFGKSYL